MLPSLALTPARRRRRRRLLKLGLLVVLFGAAAATGTLFALRLFGSADLPGVDQLAHHKPSIITRVYASNGEVIAEFAQEHRIVVSYDQIPERLRQAIVAVEDNDFYSHRGINLRGILRAAVENFKAGRVVQGGSSLTQQLAKLMFLNPQQTYDRKLKEAILALHLEREYSKEEILSFYCNEIFLGNHRYGVESAALLYFGKHAQDLTLAEAALIAGLAQRPSALEPYKHADAALERRNHVLERMRDAGYVTAREAGQAQAEPLVLQPLEPTRDALGAYFVEEVRQFLESNYGERGLYHEGLNVYTTMDPDLQRLAEQALRGGLLELDKRQGWRGSASNLRDRMPPVELETWSDPTWSTPPRSGDLVHGLVVAVTPRQATVRVGPRRGVLTQVPAWVRRASVGALYEVGDTALFRVLGLPEPGRIDLAVEQEPETEGALVALEVASGKVIALVGGWDFRRSRFNRAVQAWRQTGSAFKPLLYAAAIANGFTPADSLFDEPIAITDPWTGKVYAPENYSRTYYGFTTLREALEQSRNPMSVQLLQRIGPHAVIDIARRVGLTAKLDPYPSLALGAFEETLLEMTAAFATFADNGVLRQPYFVERIEDREGRVLYRKQPVSRPALPADVAYVSSYMMQGVVDSGTARKAHALGLPIAGKTGTTDDFTDAWFLGYSPSIACGVWVGYDVKRSLGKGEVGAKAALPIWMEFIEGAHAGRPVEDFVRPPGVELVTIDKDTGLRASPICRNTFQEAFVRGTAPVTYCTTKDHEVRALPYYLQKIYLAGSPLPPLSSGILPAAAKPAVEED